VLGGVARCRDDALATPAVEELRKRLIAGTIPAPRRLDTLQAVARRNVNASPEFSAWLMQRLQDTAEPQECRLATLDVLLMPESNPAPVLPILHQIADNEPALDFTTRVAGQLSTRIEAARKAEQPDPAWTASAGDLGLKLARAAAPDLGRQREFSRQQAMALHARALGPKAGPTLEAMVQDGKLEAVLRAAAASQLTAFAPDTAIVPALTEKYDALPVPVREVLGTTLARARDTSGATAFLVRFLKDPRMTYHRGTALMTLNVPPTTELIDAVNALLNDPQVGAHAKVAAERLGRLGQ